MNFRIDSNSSKTGITLLTTLGILLGLILYTSPKVLARTPECDEKEIETNIKQLNKNPTTLDAIIRCRSKAVTPLVKYLNELNLDRYTNEPNFDENGYASEPDFDEYPQILVVAALGEIGPEAKSAERDLARLVGGSEELNDVVLQALMRISGSASKPLIETAEDRKEDEFKRIKAISALGNIRVDQKVAPRLKAIALDTKNPECLRGRALETLKNINPKLANETLTKIPEGEEPGICDFVES
jgi:HEAT repeat protein